MLVVSEERERHERERHECVANLRNLITIISEIYFLRYYVPVEGASTEKNNARKSHAARQPKGAWVRPSFKSARLQPTPPQHTRS